jgi:hypothetical protein
MKFFIFPLCTAVALLAGCTTRPSLYEWSNYDQLLYDYYKTPASAEAFVTAMTAQVQALEAAGKRPAPGIYAELGTFALSRGNSQAAAQYYKKEMQAWPESKGLMTALIANIDKKKTGAPQ